MPAPKTKKKFKKTAFVPRGLFVGLLTSASVIPLVACGGDVRGAVSDASTGIDGVAADAFFAADVAVQAFDGQQFGVAVQAFDAGEDADGGIEFTVAACSFDGGECGPVDAGEDVIFAVGAPAFDGGADARDGGPILGVAMQGFDAG